MPDLDTNKIRQFINMPADWQPAPTLADACGLLDRATDEIDRLREVANAAREALKGIMDHYGTNLSVYNYHLNGEGEPFDNFIDENGLWDALDKLNEVLGEEEGAEDADHHNP